MTNLPAIQIVASWSRQRSREGIVACSIGTDVEIDHAALEEFCFRRMTAREADLIILVAVVAFADRQARRKIGWSRNLEISLPVSDPSFWSDTEIQNSLIEALHFISGDYWTFHFTERSPDELLRDPSPQQLLALRGATPVVLPFSHGLDSFAEAMRLRIIEPETAQLRVTALNHNVGRARFPAGGRDLFLRVPFVLRNLDHPDPTYRTRPFTFFSLAALAAVMSGSRRVVIPENGQGAIGASAVRFGNEWPHRGTHPGFTRRLSRVFKHVLGADIHFEYPNLWRTKGQVLRTLRELEADAGWESSVSCARDSRWSSFDHRRLHCGICGGCLLRRMSIYVSGISSSEEYLWQNLNAPTLEAAMRQGGRTTTANDKNIAVTSVVAMNQLARLSEMNIESVIRLSSVEGADVQRSDRLSSSFADLITSHAAEWNLFRNSLSRKSWLVTLSGG